MRNGDVYVMCIKYCCYVFQSMIYELVEAGMIDMARSYLAQNGKVAARYKEVCKTTYCDSL